MGEFELIQRFFSQPSPDKSVVLGVGDDCALLVPPLGSQLAVSIDSLIEGTHFLPGTAPEHLAERLLGAAVSDLAAMGAKPLWFTLALTLPEATEAWLAPFAARLSERAKELGIHLVGGDTTRGALALTAQVHGWVNPGDALTRKGAQPNDLICVTGTLGDSRAGLETLLAEQQYEATNRAVCFARRRFYCPEPRIATGLALVGHASACLDLSDGLAGDIKHLLHGGLLGANLYVDSLPLSPALIELAGLVQAQQWALTGGEDFELCFTLPNHKREILKSLPTPTTIVGCITQRSDVRLFLDGQQMQYSRTGFDHFASSN